MKEYLFSLEFIYLIASMTYILGLKMLGKPETARKGNLIAAAGMTIAIIGTIFLHKEVVPNYIYGLIGTAILIGTVIGWMIAKKVAMTKMPELVSLFNGMGGASAALIGLIEFEHYTGDTLSTTTIVAGIIIGSISFSGSMIAWAKLNGTLNKPLRLPKYNVLNNLIIIGVVLFASYIAWSGSESQLFIYILFFAALGYGILFVLPIEPALWLEPKGHVSVVCRHCGGGTHAYRLPVGCPGEGAEAHDRRRQRWRGWHVRGQRDEEQPVGPSREQHQQQQGLVLEPDHASVVFGRGHGPVHQV